ncbi:MAG: TRAP transporter large permease subunit, partial [Rhodospirillales bacterium]
LIVPSLIHLKVEPMAAHMFAFYYGVVSTITPPVALASFAAAAIAGSSPMGTAVESARIGIAKYLVPFAFVYNPALLFEGPLWLTCLSAVSAFISLWGLSVVLEGWFKGPVTPAMRAVIGVLSILALLPPMEPLIDGVSSFILPVAGALGIVLFAVTRRRLTPETA